MGDRLSCHGSQLVQHLLRLVGSLLELRVRPLAAKCQVEIGGIAALGDDVADEGTMRTGAFEVGL